MRNLFLELTAKRAAAFVTRTEIEKFTDQLISERFLMRFDLIAINGVVQNEMLEMFMLLAIYYDKKGV